ncbi:hypothetical protein [Diaphorobacter caeni]|uniref:hypothetical protein n=1 Tax=Diaphorobacter caeni TaxID=2784387 RepID=UPI00188FFA0E|nr:hypothetical protein [Diaphorobacter caeni]MBF5003384.1 hypothetical protein [Diaphorobacter caeni]
MAALFTDLAKVPRNAYTFLWADYVELTCICSKNGLVSKGNIDAITQEATDVQADSVDFIDKNEESEEIDDAISKKWADIHSRLTARSKQYNDWPFILDKNVLRSRFDKKNQKHCLYVAMLIASSLRLCIKQRMPDITNAFEEISYHWLKTSLNDNWEVRPFGAHQTLPNSYTGTLWEKLEKLAEDIQARLWKEKSQYDPRNTADGGIDLVAWLKIGDIRGNIPVIFGQCACSPNDWEDKQLDVTPYATEAHISPHHPGAAFCFVPHDLSANDSNWDRAEHVKRVVLIDRRRFFSLFETQASFDKLPVWNFVTDAIETNYAPAF